MRFIKYDMGATVRYISAHAISMGGLNTQLERIELFAPRIPSLSLPCKDPQLVGMTVLHFCAGVDGLPGVMSANDTQMEVLDLNELANVPKSLAPRVAGAIVPVATP